MLATAVGDSLAAIRSGSYPRRGFTPVACATTRSFPRAERTDSTRKNGLSRRRSIGPSVAREQDPAMIESALAQIAQGLVRAGVRRLILAGGETSSAAVERLDVRAPVQRQLFLPIQRQL